MKEDVFYLLTLSNAKFITEKELEKNPCAVNSQKVLEYSKRIDETLEIINKDYDELNEMKMLQQELGCPLKAFVKFISSSYVYYDNDGELLKCPYRLEDFDKKTLRTVITYEYYDPKAYHPYRTYKPIETNACKTFVINLKDYKKTWWLKEDKSE